MHCTGFIISVLAFVAFVTAGALPETVALDNGESTISVAVGGLAGRGLLEPRNPCSGSSRCSNSQMFKNFCDKTVGLIRDTTYVNGGSRSGVCAGDGGSRIGGSRNCGLFIQGQWKDKNGKKHDCKANKKDMIKAYNMIRRNGCQTCGWVTAPNQGKECKIKMDFVASC